MFNNKKEFAQAMMEGRKFVTPDGEVCFYDETPYWDSPFMITSKRCGKPLRLAASWHLFDQVTEQHWFEKPCLCWVENEIHPVIIYAYKAEKEYPYLATGNSYKKAKPLNESEMMMWLHV